MTSAVLHRLAQPMADAWRRPLSIAESGYVAFVLFVLGTAYCQLYCALAMPAMSGMTMPLSLSMWRSAIEMIPALVAFELGKRVLGHGAGRLAIAGVTGVLILSAAVSAALVLLCHGVFYASAMPLRPVIADRLPGITLTAIAVAWASRRAGLQNRETWGAKRSCLGLAIPSSAIQMPHDCIDWIESAGNYIEVHGDGRTMLLRMTLRQAAESLGSASFVQIHRSILVNRERIAKLDRAKRPHHVRLIDGTLLKVGESYRLTNV